MYLVSHMRHIRCQEDEIHNPQSVHALHILNTTHEYGPIDNITSLLKQVNKGPLLNSFEEFYIQS